MKVYDRTETYILANSHSNDLDAQFNHFLEVAADPQTTNAEIRIHYLLNLYRHCLHFERQDLVARIETVLTQVLSENNSPVTTARLNSNYMEELKPTEAAGAISHEVSVTVSNLSDNLKKEPDLLKNEDYYGYLNDIFNRLRWAVKKGSDSDRAKISTLTDTLLEANFFATANPGLSVELIKLYMACRGVTKPPRELTESLQTQVRNDLIEDLASAVAPVGSFDFIIASLNADLTGYCHTRFEKVEDLINFGEKFRHAAWNITPRQLEQVNTSLFRYNRALTELFFLYFESGDSDTPITLIPKFAASHEAYVAISNAMGYALANLGQNLSSRLWNAYLKAWGNIDLQRQSRRDRDFMRQLPFSVAIASAFDKGALDQLSPTPSYLKAITNTPETRTEFINQALTLPQTSAWFELAVKLLEENLAELKKPLSTQSEKMFSPGQTDQAIKVIRSILLYQTLI